MMKRDVTHFLCPSCRSKLGTLRTGHALMCPHQGCRFELKANGARILRFSPYRGPVETLTLSVPLRT